MGVPSQGSGLRRPSGSGFPEWSPEEHSLGDLVRGGLATKNKGGEDGVLMGGCLRKKTDKRKETAQREVSLRLPKDLKKQSMKR